MYVNSKPSTISPKKSRAVDKALKYYYSDLPNNPDLSEQDQQLAHLIEFRTRLHGIIKAATAIGKISAEQTCQIKETLALYVNGVESHADIEALKVETEFLFADKYGPFKEQDRLNFVKLLSKHNLLDRFEALFNKGKVTEEFAPLIQKVQSARDERLEVIPESYDQEASLLKNEFRRRGIHYTLISHDPFAPEAKETEARRLNNHPRADRVKTAFPKDLEFRPRVFYALRALDNAGIPREKLSSVKLLDPAHAKKNSKPYYVIEVEPMEGKAQKTIIFASNWNGKAAYILKINAGETSQNFALTPITPKELREKGAYQIDRNKFNRSDWMSEIGRHAIHDKIDLGDPAYIDRLKQGIWNRNVSDFLRAFTDVAAHKVQNLSAEQIKKIKYAVDGALDLVSLAPLVIPSYDSLIHLPAYKDKHTGEERAASPLDGKKFSNGYNALISLPSGHFHGYHGFTNIFMAVMNNSEHTHLREKIVNATRDTLWGKAVRFPIQKRFEPA